MSSDLMAGFAEAGSRFAGTEYTGIQGRAIDLLGQGIEASMVALTLGVSEGYISQLLSEDEFKRQVVDRRYEHLQRHNARDAKWDAIEDKMLEQMEAQASMIYDPMKAAKIAQIANAAKRRGQSSPDSILQSQVVVNLTMPIALVDRFRVVKDINNQVISAGDQDLVTIQSGTLLDRAKKKGIESKAAALSANQTMPAIEMQSKGIQNDDPQNRIDSAPTQKPTSQRGSIT